MNNNAGFALPINQMYSEPIHWWTPSSHKACDQRAESQTYFGSRGVTEKDLDEHCLCLNCIFTIMQAANVLGYPEGFIDKMKFQMRFPS